MNKESTCRYRRSIAEIQLKTGVNPVTQLITWFYSFLPLTT